MIVMAAVGFTACRTGPEENPNTNPQQPDNISNQGTPPKQNENSNEAQKGENNNPAVIADDVMIIAVERDVTLKPKGASQFVRILRSIPFRVGDELQIGDNSTARVLCSDSICLLSKGLYTDCCTLSCENAIRLKPPASMNQNRKIMNKSQLPAIEAQTFDGEEQKIRRLGAGDVTTQYLIADLYSSWKLVEANKELDNLSLKLKEPQAARELDALYPTVVRKTGDMYLKIDKKTEAEKNYRKVLELTPQTKDVQEKAATHVALGELYEKDGKKEKAVENLQKGKELYVQDGNVRKAEAVDKALIKARKQ